MGVFNLKYIIFSQNIAVKHPEFMAVAWSLAIEEWFYILFPLSFYLIKTLLPKVSNRLIFILVFVGFILTCNFLRIYKFHTTNPVSFDYELWESYFRKSTFLRLDSILIGVLGSYVKFYYKKLWQLSPWIMFISGILIIYIVQKTKNPTFIYLYKFIILDIGIILLFPLTETIKNSRYRIFDFFTYVSVISYSLYLIHQPIVLGVIKAKFITGTAENAVVYYIFYMIATFLLSTLCYKYVEQPFMKLRDRK